MSLTEILGRCSRWRCDARRDGSCSAGTRPARHPGCGGPARVDV